MQVNNVAIDFEKVNKETKKIKKAADDKIADYVKEKYNPIILGLDKCKGNYAKAMVKELRQEKEAVEETVKFIKKIQNMVNETAKAFKKVDQSYKKAKM